MNKLALYAAVALTPLPCAATVTHGHIYGRYNGGADSAPGKLRRGKHYYLELEALYDRIEFLKP